MKGGGVYVRDDSERFIFHYNKALTVEQLTEVLHAISQRGFLLVDRLYSR